MVDLLDERLVPSLQAWEVNARSLGLNRKDLINNTQKSASILTHGQSESL